MSKFIPVIATLVVFVAVLPVVFNAKPKQATASQTFITNCTAALGSMDADICK